MRDSKGRFIKGHTINLGNQLHHQQGDILRGGD